MTTSIHVSIFDQNGNRLKEVDFFKCIEKLIKFRKLVSDQNFLNLPEYRLSFTVDDDNLKYFFESAERRRPSNELMENITCFNIYDFYQLSVEFEYQDFEEEIENYIEHHSLSAADCRALSDFHSLDQSFFDKFISLHIDSILENHSKYRYLDRIPSSRLYIIADSSFINFHIYCFQG